MILPRRLGPALALAAVFGAVPPAAPQARPDSATGYYQTDGFRLPRRSITPTE